MVRKLLRSWVWIPAFAGMTASPVYALNSLTIMADNTLSVVVAEIARNYARDKQVAVNTSFATLQAQQAQIAEGGAADILITPREPWIEQLKMQGLIDIYSPTPIARNRLALIGPLDSPLQVSLLKTGFPTAPLINVMQYEPSFMIGHPETQLSSSFAREAMHALGASDDMEPYTVYIKRMDDMLSMIANQKAYGIFFYSSITGRDGVRVIDLLPESAHRPIRYFAVVVAGENMDEARKFLEYLKSDAAKQVIRENGLAVD